MPPSIPITVFAAFMQKLRFLPQRHLKLTRMSNGGASLTRFLYSAPLVAVLVAVHAAATEQPLPGTNARFWIFIGSGGLSQILATMCVVALFAHRNFAVGLMLKKSEVILTALTGLSCWARPCPPRSSRPSPSASPAWCCCPTRRRWGRAGGGRSSTARRF